jgi:imidazolonepropionase-like amidohydrolase
VQPGAPASFLVLDADPSSDIAGIRKLSMIVLRGRILRLADLPSGPE